MQSFGKRPTGQPGVLTPRFARDPDDKRFAPRRSSQMPALLTFDDAHESVPCVIRDMSTTGARVELKGSYTENPFNARWSSIDHVRLVVRSDHVMYECRIVRRSEPREIGLKFAAAPKQMPRLGR